LREHAGIDPQGSVMVLGSLDQIEIWNPTAYLASEEVGQQEIAGVAR
jgi:DNA-binding transcriptional regulator/RsmH inhibitor MraZ